jgi:hypothetical protein
MGQYMLSPAESPKSVLTPIRAPITVMITGGGALCTGADGPQPGSGGPRPGVGLGFLPDGPNGLRMRRGGCWGPSSSEGPQKLD